MATIPEEYIRNPLIPDDTEGKDIYLANELDKISSMLTQKSGWKDNFAALAGQPGGSSAPTLTAFGPSGTVQQSKFGVGDSIYVIWHIDHDVLPDSLAYMHVHWASGGTDVTSLVNWQISYTIAKGHNQEAFPADTVLGGGALEEVSGGQWFHMVTEDATGFTIPEPDSLVIAEVKRIAATTGPDNADDIFGLFVDIHYQSDRDYTPYRSPDFYSK